MPKHRVFKSIYFKGARAHGKKKNDITLSFNMDDELYRKIENLSSSEIRRIIGVDSYGELLEVAKQEHRTSGNFIKHKLSIYFKM